MKNRKFGDSWQIELGYEGPTDACLVLVYCTGKGKKQYAIESVAWQLLSLYYNKEKIPIEIASWIWWHRNEDIFDVSTP